MQLVQAGYIYPTPKHYHIINHECHTTIDFEAMGTSQKIVQGLKHHQAPKLQQRSYPQVYIPGARARVN